LPAMGACFTEIAMGGYRWHAVEGKDVIWGASSLPSMCCSRNI